MFALSARIYRECLWICAGRRGRGVRRAADAWSGVAEYATPSREPFRDQPAYPPAPVPGYALPQVQFVSTGRAPEAQAASERPRVVYVTATLPFGRSEHFVVPEIDGLDDQGIEVVVCPRRWHSSHVDSDRSHLLAQALEPRLFSLPIFLRALRSLVRSPARVVRAVWRLRASRSRGVLAKNLAVVPKALWLAEYARSHRVRHLHAHWASTTATLAMLASEISGVPYSFTAHRWDIAEDNLLTAKVRSAAFVRAIDQLGAQELAKLSGVVDSDIAVIHMGVVAPPVVAIRDLKQPPVIVIPAALVEIKGHKYLLQAIELLVERGVRVRLEIVGEGPERTAIEHEIEARHLDDYVVIRGFVPHDQLLRELEAGRYDIAVLPSVGTAADAREGIPVALMEALAAGVPSVATRMGGIPELLHDGAGVLVPERDPEAIASAVERLTSDSAFRRSIIERGSARVRTEFAIDMICIELARRFLSN
jgi:colanic acid/amylovoran biosynthesis glycosyltransferase